MLTGPTHPRVLYVPCDANRGVGMTTSKVLDESADSRAGATRRLQAQGIKLLCCGLQASKACGAGRLVLQSQASAMGALHDTLIHNLLPTPSPR